MKNYFSWLYSYGVRRDLMFHGLVWRVSEDRQRQTMREIRSQIIPARGIRITTDEIPGFPELDIQCQMVDIEGAEEIDKIYEEIQQENKTIRARSTTGDKGLCSALEQLRRRSELDKSPESAITKILRARQRIELLKVPAAIEIAQDRLDCGHSIGIFCEFRATVIELARRLECGFIDGSVTGPSRDAIIADFQANKTRCIVLNSQAGGIAISLQDLDGEHPRMGLIFPGFSATVLVQVLGRFRRDGGKSKCHYRILLAANTIERRIKAVLDQKMDNLAALLDSDLIP